MRGDSEVSARCRQRGREDRGPTKDGAGDGHLHSDSRESAREGRTRRGRKHVTHSVVGRGSTAELVEDDERPRTGLGQDLGALVELDLEGRGVAKQEVVRAHPRADGVDGRDAGRRVSEQTSQDGRDATSGQNDDDSRSRGGRHIHAELGHDDACGRRPQEGRFSGHVSARGMLSHQPRPASRKCRSRRARPLTVPSAGPSWPDRRPSRRRSE